MAGKTYLGSSFRAGSAPSEGSDAGHAVLTKQTTIQAGGVAADDASVTLPAGAEIVDIILDTVVAHTATTYTMDVGVTAGGTEYVTALNIKAAGRFRPTFTAAQLTAMDDIGSNTVVYFQSNAGTPSTTGTTRAKVLYRMRADGE